MCLHFLTKCHTDFDPIYDYSKKMMESNYHSISDLQRRVEDLENDRKNLYKENKDLKVKIDTNEHTIFNASRANEELKASQEDLKDQLANEQKRHRQTRGELLTATEGRLRAEQQEQENTKKLKLFERKEKEDKNRKKKGKKGEWYTQDQIDGLLEERMQGAMAKQEELNVTLDKVQSHLAVVQKQYDDVSNNVRDDDTNYTGRTLADEMSKAADEDEDLPEYADNGTQYDKVKSADAGDLGTVVKKEYTHKGTQVDTEPRMDVGDLSMAPVKNVYRVHNIIGPRPEVKSALVQTGEEPQEEATWQKVVERSWPARHGFWGWLIVLSILAMFLLGVLDYIGLLITRDNSCAITTSGGFNTRFGFEDDDFSKSLKAVPLHLLAKLLVGGPNALPRLTFELRNLVLGSDWLEGGMGMLG